MNLPGRLRSTTLGDVFGALHRERATGVLELLEDFGLAAGRSHAVEFDTGLVTQVSSALPCSPLGEILRREGFLGEEAARRLRRRIAERPAKRTGELLVEERLVSPVVVSAALRYQLKLRCDALFQLPDARITFHVPRARGSRAGSELPLTPGEFLHGRKRARSAHYGGPSASSAAQRRPRASAPGVPLAPIDPARRRALLTLGLEPRADRETVHRAFRRLAAQLHPDRFPAASAEERAIHIQRFAELSAAYHALIR